MQFSDRFLKSIKGENKVKDIREGRGFGIRVFPSGEKTFFYTIRFANISRDCEAIIGALRDRGLFITSSGNARKLVDFTQGPDARSHDHHATGNKQDSGTSHEVASLVKGSKERRQQVTSPQ